MSSPGLCHKCGRSPDEWRGCGHSFHLPDSLRDQSKRKRKPCVSCGKMTQGAEYTPQTRLNLDGSIDPLPPHQCADCAPTSAIKRKVQSWERERKSESYRSGR